MKTKIFWILTPLVIAGIVGIWLFRKYRVAPAAPWKQTELIRENQTKLIISEFSERPYVLLDYFGSWCINCREELPELLKLQNDFRADLKVFIVHEEDPETMEKLRIQQPELPELLKSARPFSRSGIHTYPTSYLIRTTDGAVAFSKAGQLTEHDWKTVKKILRKKTNPGKNDSSTN